MRSRLPQPTCTRRRAEVRELGYPTIGGAQNVGKIKHQYPAPDALAAEIAYHSAPSKGKDLPLGTHLTGYDTDVSHPSTRALREAHRLLLPRSTSQDA